MKSILISLSWIMQNNNIAFLYYLDSSTKCGS